MLTMISGAEPLSFSCRACLVRSVVIRLASACTQLKGWPTHTLIAVAAKSQAHRGPQQAS